MKWAQFFTFQPSGYSLSLGTLANEKDGVSSLLHSFMTDGVVKKQTHYVSDFEFVEFAKGVPSTRSKPRSQCSTAIVRTSRMFRLPHVGVTHLARKSL